jgi:hypothetical protein
MIANPRGTYPIPYQETWNVTDPSKIEVWNDCKRKFFFEHILGWRSDAPNIHLIFGEGMHHALEHMLIEGIANKRGYEMDVIREAHEKFLDYFRQHFSKEEDSIYHPKTPDNMLQGLLRYASRYEQEDMDSLDILYTEVGGTVPISSEFVVSFRIDAVVWNKIKQAYHTLEHKSGSGINRFWTDKWDLHHQPFTYTHVLYSTLDPNLVTGVKINGIHFMKSKCETIRIPVWKTPDQMNAWLWEVRDIFSEMEFEFRRFSECKTTDKVLQAFPKNPNNCTKYFGCAFHDFCCAWQNPLAKADNPPMGFAIDYWDPRTLHKSTEWDLTDANFIGKDTHTHLYPGISDPDSRNGV